MEHVRMTFGAILNKFPKLRIARPCYHFIIAVYNSKLATSVYCASFSRHYRFCGVYMTVCGLDPMGMSAKSSASEK